MEQYVKMNKKISLRFGFGMSLIGIMIATGLMALLVSSHLKTYSFVATGAGQIYSDQLIEQLARISETVTNHVNRGGALGADPNTSKGFLVCVLNASATACNQFNGQRANLCLGIPIQIGNHATAKNSFKGFRHYRGVLQQRNIPDTNIDNLNFQSFCTENLAWEDMHDPKEFKMDVFMLCRFDAGTFSGVMANYSSNCPTVLQANLTRNMFWLVSMNANPVRSGASNIEQSRIMHLFNNTRVTTL